MSKIDEIIGEFDTWCRCGNKECMLTENYTNAKAELLQLVLKVIGELKDDDREYSANILKQQQRQKAYELFGKEQDNGS